MIQNLPNSQIPSEPLVVSDPLAMAAMPSVTAAKPMAGALALSEVCAAIAQAIRDETNVEARLAALSSQTGLPMVRLQAVLAQVARHLALHAPTPADALALDVLAENFHYGLTLRGLEDGALLHYEATHWAALSPQVLRSALRPRALQNPPLYGASSTSVPAALAAIRDLAPPGGELLLAPPRPVVNVQNAELWVGKAGVEARPHDPASGLRHVLPVTYDPGAACPRFDAMLEQIFAKSGDTLALIAHFLELLGYAIQGVRDLPVILFMWGGGSNGKSTLLTILQAIVGEPQVWAGSLNALSNDRFVLANLVDKLVFIEDDAKDGERLNDGLLKKIAENKIIHTRRLHASHGMGFRSMVMPIIAINGAPALEDTSTGLRRRLHVIPFDRHFTPEEIDPDLGNAIIRDELPGVLNRLLDGLVRLRARGRFDPPAPCEAAKARFLSAANPLHAFLDERCNAAPGKVSRLSDVWAAFAAWCRAEGQRLPFPQRSLRTRLQALGYVVRKSNVMVVDDLVVLGEA